MAQTGTSREAALLQADPKESPHADSYGGRVRLYRAIVDLAAQAVGEVALMTLPAGSIFSHGRIQSTVTLGSAVVSIGNATTPTKYRAAAVYTAVETETAFGLTTAKDDDALAASEDVILTVATAALPASGVLIVDIYVAAA